jgi:hypothetical protein
LLKLPKIVSVDPGEGTLLPQRSKPVRVDLGGHIST